MGQTESQPYFNQNPVNYHCPVCKNSNQLPNLAGKFFLVGNKYCQCNGCKTVFEKECFYQPHSATTIIATAYIDDATNSAATTIISTAYIDDATNSTATIIATAYVDDATNSATTINVKSYN